MKYTFKIQHAIRFAIKTHEVYQKQKRKGKDIPYITHPLTVGLILACAGTNEDVIAAGILHDTMEDSVSEKKVSKEMLIEKFGQKVADLVESVTEKNRELPWEERKRQALEHIKEFSHDSVLVKAADVISNGSEVVEDYNKYGDEIFTRFNAPKEKSLQKYLRVISAIMKNWPQNPLAGNLTYLAQRLQEIGESSFMATYPALSVEYKNYNKNKEMECPVCNWQGLPDINNDSHFALEANCPICGKMLLVANYPSCSSE